MTEVSTTVSKDIPFIKELVTLKTKAIFGVNVNVQSIVEKSCINVTQRNAKREVTSSIHLIDFPPIATIPADSWLHWTKKVYRSTDLTYSNTQFIHLLVWSNIYKETFLDSLLNYIYQHFHFLQHIVLVIPKYVGCDNFILQHFKPLQKIPELHQTHFSLPFYINSRKYYLPKTEIKYASLKDVDGILDLLETMQKNVKHVYMTRLIQELSVLEKNSDRICLIAIKGEAVLAFIILNRNINHQVLLEQYDLSMYSDFLFTKNIRGRSQMNSKLSTTSSITHSSNSMLQSFIAGAEDAVDRPSVFAIETLAVDYKYEYIIPDILEAAFQDYFPDCEFCILSTKSKQYSPIFKFLNLLLPKHEFMSSDDLYIISKTALLGEIYVRFATLKDIDDLSNLIEDHQERRIIMDDLIKCLESEQSDDVFLIYVENHVTIGFAILSRGVDSTFVDSHFLIGNICDYSCYRDDEQGVIKHFFLSPLFLNQSRLVVKQLLRVSGLSCLTFFHYKKQCSDISANEDCPIIFPDVIQVMLPIKPRVLMKYSSRDNFSDYKGSQKRMPSACYFINRRIASQVQKAYHIRIVVVGTSMHAISFIENLIFDNFKDACFKKLTLISDHNMFMNWNLAYNMLITDGLHDEYYFTSLGLDSWVTSKKGHVTDINVCDKKIIIDEKYKQSFDYLFLFPELEPKLIPDRTIRKNTFNQSLTGNMRETNISNKKNNMQLSYDEKSTTNFMKSYADEFQNNEQSSLHVKIENLFCVKNRENAVDGLKYVSKLVNEKPDIDPILIIGNSLNAYACIRSLISIGTEEIGEKLILINLITRKGTDLNDLKFQYLNNNEVSQLLTEQCEHYGVQNFKQVKFIFYELNDNQSSNINIITSMTFETPEQTLLTLSCSAIFVFDPKDLENTLLNALKTAGVTIQNNKILINNFYQTNVPCIYAAGNGTTYQARFLEDNKMHEYYNSREVGADVSKTFKKILTNTSKHESSTLFPEYKDCLVEYCVLPGEYNYLHIFAPGKTITTESMELDQLCNEKSTVIKSGAINKEKSNSGYFQIFFDFNKFVKEIICVTQHSINIYNTLQLYNKHASVLNNIIERNYIEPINDLYEYFEQPWTKALYYDKSKTLFEQIDTLFEMPNEEEKTFNDIMKTIHENSTKKNDENKKIIEVFLKFKILNYDLTETYIKDAIIKKLIEFLEENSDYLPMYATPKIIEKTIPSKQEDTSINKTNGEQRKMQSLLTVPKRGFYIPSTIALNDQEILQFMRENERDVKNKRDLTFEIVRNFEEELINRDGLSILRKKKQ